MFSPNKLIRANLNSYNKDIDPSYRSSLQFDYINDYVREAPVSSELVSTESSKEKTALLLTSYLAHWGMYRGSSKLKDTNIIFIKDLVDFLLNANNGTLNPIAATAFENLHALEKGVIGDVINCFKSYLNDSGVSPTSTLMSKIILALLGNMPAYDRIFNAGLRKLKNENKYDGVLCFGEAGIRDLSKWYAGFSWPNMTSDINPKHNLPSGRLVDLAVFQYGI